MAIGPIYCETGHAIGVIAEPVNTVTNAFILAAAVAALIFVSRRARLRTGYVVLIGLLFLTGLGSTWWHALRTPVGLAADFIPGLLFLFAFVWMWARRLFSRTSGSIIFLAAYLASMALVAYLLRGVALPFFFPLFASSFFFGGYLIYRTWARYGRSLGMLGFWTIVSALAAAIFRSSDLAFCAIVPFGLHFLWHMFLSLAAFLAIRLVVDMDLQTSAESVGLEEPARRLDPNGTLVRRRTE